MTSWPKLRLKELFHIKDDMILELEVVNKEIDLSKLDQLAKCECPKETLIEF